MSNLTNLLAFTAAGLSFTRFALMTLPWPAVIIGEYILLRALFRDDLAAVPAPDTTVPAPELPLFVLVVLGLTPGGFAVTSPLGLSPVWAGTGRCVVLGVRRQRRSTVACIVRSANMPFLAFVLCLGVVVDAVMVHGLDDAMREVLPAGDGIVGLVGTAAIAAVLSNVVNNLPAVLLLPPLVAGAGPAAVLAVLIGTSART